jgi:C-methyltransferase C-terminal domain/Putative zinc binding domain
MQSPEDDVALVDAPLPAAQQGWSCRWCHSKAGVKVLDLGMQPAADLFPSATEPEPDPTYPLAMVMCASCGLAQLETDPTTPGEPRGVEPAALVKQAEAAINDAVANRYVWQGGRALEYQSPHGGSWTAQLEQRGMSCITGGDADLIIDNFGMMHEADQRAAFQERVSHMSADAVLLIQFHTLAAITRLGIWNALRHGHFAYYSTPVLVAMAEELDLTAINAWKYSLYGGTVVLACARKDSKWRQSPSVLDMIVRELDMGVTDPKQVAALGRSVALSVHELLDYIVAARAAGQRISGYGAASRSAALLQSAQLTRDDLLAVADASAAKHGRMLPGSRIPIISPAELVATQPDRVLLFVPDLLSEVRTALPEIEGNGGRWVVLNPTPAEVQPGGQNNAW